MAAVVDTSSSQKYFRKALGDLTINNYGQIKALHEAVPSVSRAVFDDAVYKEALALDPISRLVYFNDICAGTVLCRKIPTGATPITATSDFDIEIFSLVVLPAYTRLGLASMLIANVIEEASKDPKISQIFVALNAEADIAKTIYEKHGFVAATGRDPASDSLIHLVKSV
ncbi:hypothetical protein BASA60_009437 [Batrachochytrium salamandrivorans]|nr:hypothetical protein BASA62_010344 [Batrachochytrium salamandrivorans]KAH6566505.1 hypothetical protein BASA60_009437 [Batrachochytrium salamandrivorans]